MATARVAGTAPEGNDAVLTGTPCSRPISSPRVSGPVLLPL